MATITYASSSLPKVKPWVQACADEIERRFGVTYFGTYGSHSPTPDRAFDAFASQPKMREVAWWLAQPEQVKRFGIDYIIFDIDAVDFGEIFNPPDRAYWRDMEDRGGATQNHKDHVHVSFDATAPDQEDDPMAAYTDAEREELLNAARAINAHQPIGPADLTDTPAQDVNAAWAAKLALAGVLYLQQQVEALGAKLDARPAGSGADAKAVADELAERLKD